MKTHVDWGGPNQEYRYTLWRVWDNDLPILQFIGLNPSTADEEQDDPTIRRCRGFAELWGFGSICMTNLFAFRATKPENMKRAQDPIGELNDDYLLEVHKHAELTVAAWGNHGTFMGRDQTVRGLIDPLFVLKLNKATQQPAHPLYLPKLTEPFEWRT